MAGNVNEKKIEQMKLDLDRTPELSWRTEIVREGGVESVRREVGDAWIELWQEGSSQTGSDSNKQKENEENEPEVKFDSSDIESSTIEIERRSESK
jgi:hypothetical protein